MPLEDAGTLKAWREDPAARRGHSADSFRCGDMVRLVRGTKLKPKGPNDCSLMPDSQRAFSSLHDAMENNPRERETCASGQRRIIESWPFPRTL